MDACVSLLASVHQIDGYPSPWPRDPGAWLAGPDLVFAWVAELERGVAGHVALTRSGTVTRLMVAPWARRRALATRLLELASERATALAVPASLDVVQGRRAAVALYERAGWRCAGLHVDAAGRRLYRYLAPGYAATAAGPPSASASSPREPMSSLR